MTSWGEFEAAAPELATHGRQLLYRTAEGEALLATVRGGGLPRVHPINVAIVEGRLVAFITSSPKASDLASDGRYALHNHQDPAVPNEFQVRGRAVSIDDEAVRARIAGSWYFEAGDEYRLFEFLIEHALLGQRAAADEWPPRYTSWKSDGLA